MKGKPTRGKAVDVGKVIELYNQGLSMCEIGRQLGHCHGVIAYHIHKSGVVIHNPRQQRCPVSTDYIKELYEKGMATTEIGEKTNLTPQSIYGRLLKSGVKLRSFSEALSLASKRGRMQQLTGGNNPRWKGGRYIGNDGYVTVRVDCKQLSEHRLVWEKAYGTIPKGWVIHHLNGIRDDNRLENLIAMSRKRHSPSKIIEPHQVRIRQLEEQIYNLQKESRRS